MGLYYKVSELGAHTRGAWDLLWTLGASWPATPTTMPWFAVKERKSGGHNTEI